MSDWLTGFLGAVCCCVLPLAAVLAYVLVSLRFRL